MTFANFSHWNVISFALLYVPSNEDLLWLEKRGILYLYLITEFLYKILTFNRFKTLYYNIINITKSFNWLKNGTTTLVPICYILTRTFNCRKVFLYNTIIETNAF